MKNKKASVAFSFCLSPFSANLIRFTFLIFPDTSGRMVKFWGGRGEAEKLAGSGGKSSAYLHRNRFYGRNKKNATNIGISNNIT